MRGSFEPLERGDQISGRIDAALADSRFFFVGPAAGGHGFTHQVDDVIDGADSSEVDGRLMGLGPGEEACRSGRGGWRVAARGDDGLRVAGEPVAADETGSTRHERRHRLIRLMRGCQGSIGGVARAFKLPQGRARGNAEGGSVPIAGGGPRFYSRSSIGEIADSAAARGTGAARRPFLGGSSAAMAWSAGPIRGAVMNVLVVGGAGYIGSHLVRLLAESGHGVVVLDNLSTGFAAAVTAGRLVVGDLADRRACVQLLRNARVDAVMHFAACALVGESVADPAKYYRNNVLGALELLDAMREAGVMRLVFSSTCATYGVPERIPMDESQPQQPVNPYGFTKLVIERALGDYARAYGLGYAALRYFNAAGASPRGDLGEDHRPESHLIPLVLQVALGQRPHVAVFGDDYPTPDGTCVRDYVHVDDLGAAHLAALERLTPGTELALNLGTGRGYSVREVIEVCRRVSGKAIPEVVGPRRPGDPPELVADARRAAEVLGWAPRYGELEAIVETAWNWHRQHPRGYSVM